MLQVVAGRRTASRLGVSVREDTAVADEGHFRPGDGGRHKGAGGLVTATRVRRRGGCTAEGSADWRLRCVAGGGGVR